ncbi:M16 family metallopeptidase [Devosia sp. SL43]|uniref:M16 family metallopeptidase n=1 Tax=Devosia sp. SL43 TaxID=2806348 RepID=UPI001F444DBA|nr:pitrilysin family protein [Devosia sp. SL43]
MIMLPMLRRALFAALFILPALPAHAEVAFQQITSPKGISAWLVEDYSVPIVTIRFSFMGGTSQDPEGKEGLANLMTYMFDEGAGDLTSEPFQIALDTAGAEMGFAADLDAVHGSMRMLADQRDESLALLKLAIESPRFDVEAVDRMRDMALSDLIAAAQDPSTEANRLWTETLYGDHPYARPIAGTVETVTALTPDDLRAFHKAMFARDNLYVGIVGAISADEAAATLDLLFGNLPQQPDLTPVSDIVPTYGQSLKIDYDLPQTAIYLAYPGIKRDDPDFLAASLMNQILGGDSFTSRLTAELREKRGLTYNIGSSLQTFEHADALIIGTATRTTEALAIIEDVVAEMATNGPTEAELAAVKKYAIGSYAINELASSSTIARTLVGLQMKGLGINYVSDRTRQIEAITLDQVKAVAARLLGTKPTVLMLGPKS